MLCDLGNHSVIHTSSCKRVHEFARNHCECDSGNVIWRKTRLGFGIRTKIRMASEISPHPTSLFSLPPLNWRRLVGGRWYPSLKGPFLQSSAPGKSVLSLYENKYCTSVLLLPLSCCFILLSFLPWSFLVMTCLTFTLAFSCHKFHPGWRKTKGSLSKESSGILQFFFERVSRNYYTRKEIIIKEWNQKQFLWKSGRSPGFLFYKAHKYCVKHHYFFILIFDQNSTLMNSQLHNWSMNFNVQQRLEPWISRQS